ncbi:YegP family protein [Parahaliea sp. F7430]|uniref:YegP family protein n=1 Tax=Sediminihaliea albiluteola TaxID=2758564 RepID=A0A7W2YJ26_9GAMM|nr:YegP family protein [Sediminihaliea albiluteola]MBA6411858.1 YegP family protein [Sediminihaliea albiluteola]
MAGKFELKQGDSGKYSFNLKSGNGQVILTSQTYTSKSGALNGIESVRKNSQDDARFERKVAKDDSPFFVLNASNGQVIGKSQMYSGDAAMENGIESVKKNAPEAALVDTTAE